MSSGLLVQYLSNAGIDDQNSPIYDNPGAEPPPDSGLINGQMTGSSFNFEPNLRYRLRLINMATLTEFVFSVDNHILEVVESDGTSVVGAAVHRVPINVAQRYSVILTTNQTLGSYNVRAEMQDICYKLDNPNLDTMVLGTPGDCIDLNATQLVPVIESPPPNSTMTVSVSMSFQQTFASGGQATLGYMNNTSWEADSTDPTLMQMYNAGAQTSFSQSQLIREYS